VIQAVRSGVWRRLEELSEGDRLALELAERGTVTPPDIDDEFFSRLTACYSAPEIVELSAIVAWENYRARFNVILGIEGHGFYE
jgi:alkylhydroperoxidase family enzyme